MSATPGEGRQTSSPRAPKDPRIGKVIDRRYRILSVIGSGGLGTVYRADDQKLGRAVAMKLLLEDFAVVSDLAKRFDRESQVLSKLNHPNIVTCTDFGRSDGMPFLVMELLEGRTLEVMMRDGPAPIDRTFEIMKQILRGLAYAHKEGIAHRDLKPANVFLQALPDGEHVRLLDFGLARFIDPDRDGEATRTQAGMVFGTPAYMSPEQAAGGRADERADVYAAGILLFELLCGRRPFVEAARADLMRAHVIDAPPDPSDVRPGLQLSLPLRAVITKALAKKSSDRYAHAAEMLAALDALPPDAAKFDASNAKSPGTASIPGDDATVAAVPSARSSAGASVRGSGGVEIKRNPANKILAAIALAVLAVLVLAGGWVAYHSIFSYDYFVGPPRADEIENAPPPRVDGPGTTSHAPLPHVATPHPNDGHPTPPTPLPPPNGHVAIPTPPVPVPPLPAFAGAYDPWAPPIPQDLASRHAKLLAHGYDAHDIDELQAWVRPHNQDARYQLLFAEALVDIGHNEEAALERYRLALVLDARVSLDGRVLADVTALAGARGARGKKHELLQAIDAKLADATDPGVRARLEALRAPLAANVRVAAPHPHQQPHRPPPRRWHR